MLMIYVYRSKKEEESDSDSHESVEDDDKFVYKEDSLQFYNFNTV